MHKSHLAVILNSLSQSRYVRMYIVIADQIEHIHKACSAWLHVIVMDHLAGNGSTNLSVSMYLFLSC